MFKHYIGQLFGGLIALIVSAAAYGQPLNERVLIVYNSNVPESLDVATHYRIARSIPSSNLCAIAPPSTTTVTDVQYSSTVRTPVRDCVRAAGLRNILYIVLSWGTPYKVTTASRAFSVDSALADMWNDVGTIFPTHPDRPCTRIRTTRARRRWATSIRLSFRWPPTARTHKGDLLRLAA